MCSPDAKARHEEIHFKVTQSKGTGYLPGSSKVATNTYPPFRSQSATTTACTPRSMAMQHVPRGDSTAQHRLRTQLHSLCVAWPPYSALCKTMQRYATLCNAMQHYAATLCNTTQHYVATRCNTMLHDMQHYEQCYATLRNTMRQHYAPACCHLCSAMQP
eukprot:6207195-Pleurochrysis_carterae.AAC.14